MLKSLKNIPSSLKHTILLSAILVSYQNSIAAISRTILNAPGSQAAVSYSPGDTMRVITNESGIIDSLDLIPGDGLTASYRFTQELLSTLSISGKQTTIAIKIEKVSPSGSLPIHTILYDPTNGGTLYRKLFPLPTWISVSTTGSLNSSSVPSQTRYGIVRDPITLPIELVSFNGIMKDGYPYLSWTTASEINNKHFLIQRSYDAVRFDEIGKVSGSGNAFTLQEYHFVDTTIDKNHQGDVYYQLVQVDGDNNVHFVEQIIVLRVFQDVNTPYKNIVCHSGLLTIPGLDNYTILSLRGQNIMNGIGPKIEISHLSTGIYILYDHQKNRIIKLIVQ